MNDFKRQSLSFDKKGSLQSASSWIILINEIKFNDNFFNCQPINNLHKITIDFLFQEYLI